jgi:alpha-2-macroglobulin
VRRQMVAALLGIVMVAAQAARVESVSPRGEVVQLQQVVVRFSAPVQPFGDLRGTDPFILKCTGPAPQGAGRWSDERVWLYDFAQPLPAGVRCTLKVKAGWQPREGTLEGDRAFSFGTSGPVVQSVQPWGGAEIEEEQHFLLTLSGPAEEASVAAHAWCEVEGIGERLPLRVVTGAPREALLKSRRVKGAQAANSLLVACARPLPQDTPVRLRWGAGIAAAANPDVLTRAEQRFDFRVRKSFTAEFSCERERAEAPCLPIRPLRLRFSAPVARVMAEQALLRPAVGAPLKPVFDRDDRSNDVREIAFPHPLPENAAFSIELPTALKDDAGRLLANASLFPLKVATGEAPPMAKFAAAPFGVLEHGRDGMEAVLPITLRHVQGDLRPAAAGGQVRIKRLQSDADVLAWYARVADHHEQQRTAREAGLPESDWFTIERDTDARGRPVERRVDRMVGTREISLLRNAPGVQRLNLPQLQGGDPRPFEVVGLPLAAPGYHVVEVESARLGAALLGKTAPMYVRTGVLVTNLGVHVKHGRENSLLWVTSLDRGRPVDGAEVAVNDCNGQRLWAGRTDAQGLARIAQPLDAERPRCVADAGLFVTARKAGSAGGAEDMAFVFSSWQKGIESWRFNVPTSQGAVPDARAHTVFDRTLLRAGETVSMKHFIRRENLAGLAALPAGELPTRLKIIHVGSGQEVQQPLQWPQGRYALSNWTIPPGARLGAYQVVLERDAGGDAARERRWPSGEFRVEAFRVPLVDARLAGPKGVQVAPKTLPLTLQLSYLSGGGVAQAAVSASALLKPRAASFKGFEDFSFSPPRDAVEDGGSGDDEMDGEASSRARAADGILVADKLSLTTDARGAAALTLDRLPPITRPGELLAELSFSDPNGETQTVATRVELWPSAVVLGLKTGSWVSNRGRVSFTTLALDTAGKPLAGQAVEVRGRVQQRISTRKRMVGGFYAYDNRREVKELGVLCSGRSDANGRLACEADVQAAGEVELVASAQDAAGRPAQAAATVWITRRGELWFEQDNDDRIDVLPEKKRYEPGETARLQVRMPFRSATALVAVEREGVIETRVVTLRGDDPTIELKIDKVWAPNVYVSVLALRGRVRDVPWYSFFTWGWTQPRDWWRAWRDEAAVYQAPTAMIDLAKPSFKLGVAALQVGLAEHELQVSVTPDQPQYGVRQKALARIKVTQGGQPLAGTEVAFAAVDEGLLALRDNASWELLDAMLRQRAWGVETATAQSEIVGRRHYGRKAVAAGGGGGRGAARELFDTLLLWKPAVLLDARGEAVIEVALNDSLTSFRLVAVADQGTQRFGSGSARIRVTQDLQLLPGLPPLVRDGDNFRAMLTLRNTTARPMSLRATLEGSAQREAGAAMPITLAPQQIELAAGAAQEIGWPVEVPAGSRRIDWEAVVQEQTAGPGAAVAGAARDAVKLRQAVLPAVPARVLQATLTQLDGRHTLPVAAPADALPASGPKAGGLVIGVQPRLSGALPGLRRYFETYPFSCLEQKASQAIGLQDKARWAALVNALPTHLDRDGLAAFFPLREGDRPAGSDRLTAYLLQAAHQSGFELPAELRSRMLDGLTAFAEGRIERRMWSPREDLAVRKLAALDALSRHGRAQARQLGSIQITPQLWPTAAVIDWLGILRRVDGVPAQAAHLAEAQQILRGRLSYAGTTLRFSNEQDDFWWWLMDSADGNAARLILAVLDDPAWREDLPRMVVGLLGRQRGGTWLTTTANLWGSLALDQFSARFESQPVTGRTMAALEAGLRGPKPATGSASSVAIDPTTTATATAAVDWALQPEGATLHLPWPPGPALLSVVQRGDGRPWLSVQSLAAVPLKAPLRAGYSVTRRVAVVTQQKPGQWSRGDVMRVRLEVDAQSDMSWVVVSDPVPGGATLLGSGLGRDSAIATRGETREGSAWPAFEERAADAFRSYFDFLPRGRHVIEYSLRLGNPGRFALPPTRVEAMYAPESFGELPNDAVVVEP